MNARKFSIIMPAYNVEDEVVDVINALKKEMAWVTEDYEVIVVNDGSEDRTRRVLEGLGDSRLRVINHRKNLGKGAAIKTGVEHAKGEYMIILDADKDIDVKNIRQYIDALKEYDIVVGSKRHPNSTYQAPLIRKVLSIGYNMFVKMLLGIRIGDTQTGFKAFRTKHLKMIMKVIAVNGYSWDAEVLAVASMLKLKIAEVPVNIKQNKLFSIRGILRMLMETLGIAYRLRIARCYQKNLGKRSS
jgi:glycosyltransferase involved in cell wall biosynthesis